MCKLVTCEAQAKLLGQWTSGVKIEDLLSTDDSAWAGHRKAHRFRGGGGRYKHTNEQVADGLKKELTIDKLRVASCKLASCKLQATSTPTSRWSTG